ncbi:ABC transporter substrate-binding protein [Gordonia caeni]|uniref:Fe/B12 periplasmic-binding domain-containing protein n=1 Tax=Gordonia caeni TaxID=1007097 RepID=A0ABP7P2Q3_9ACTN
MNDRNGRLSRWAAVAAAGVLAVGLVGCSSGTDSADGERTVDLQGVETTIPDHADRIISIHNASTQPLIEAGGADRIIAALEMPAAMVPPANRAAFEAIPDKIELNTPAESLAAMSPDLIVTFDSNEPGNNEEMTKIAPVAVMQISGPGRADWQGRSQAAGEILGSTDKVDDLRSALTERQETIKKTYADVLAANTVTVLDSYETGNLYASGTKSMVGDLFGQAGVRFAPSVSGDGTRPESNPGEFEASTERLGDYLDADIIFVGSNYDGQYNQLQKDLLANPLLAARSASVQPLGLLTISSYAQANYMLDQLEKALKAARDEK